jgi:hypothetical protein
MIVVFPIAYVWHLVLFEDVYRRLGYMGRSEPIVALGFLAIASQGLILSRLYPVVSGHGSFLSDGLRLGLIAGAYHWTIHVVSEAARQPLAPLSVWFGIETAYLAIQFCVAGVAIAIAHRRFGKT